MCDKMLYGFEAAFVFWKSDVYLSKQLWTY